MWLLFVDSRLLATLVNKLEYVNMNKCWLKSEQMDILFFQMSDRTKLKTLWIDESILTSVDSKTLSICINQLEDVSLLGSRLTNQQVIKNFR